MLIKFISRLITGLVFIGIGTGLMIYEVGTNFEFVNESNTYFEQIISVDQSLNIKSDIKQYSDDFGGYTFIQDSSLKENEVKVVVTSFDPKFNLVEKNYNASTKTLTLKSNIKNRNVVKRVFDLLNTALEDKKVISSDEDIYLDHVKIYYSNEKVLDQIKINDQDMSINEWE